MANAVAQQQPGMTPTETGFQVTYIVNYAGTDVANGTDYSEVTVDFLYTDTPQTMGTKIGAVVRAEATRLGYTVGSNAVVTNGFSKV